MASTNKVNCVCCNARIAFGTSCVFLPGKVGGNKRRNARDSDETPVPRDCPEYLFDALAAFEAMESDGFYADPYD